MSVQKANREEIEGLPTQEEVLMDEDALLKGILEASNFKTDAGNQKLIQVKRNGKLLFQFHVRPLEEDELQNCRKQATKFMPNPQNRHLKMEVDVDYVKLRSLKIYTATVEMDREKTWDNPALRDKLSVITGADAIDKVLMAGEKDEICDVIDDISGYNIFLETAAKN
jgi:Phage XkdN-like protein.